MIRISHKTLETARKDPTVLRPAPGKKEFKGGPSGMQYFKWALQKYVYVGERDDAKAAEYIERSMTARKRTIKGRSQRSFSNVTVEKYLEYLASYLRTMPAVKPVRFQDRLTIDVLGKAEIGGIIDRVDLIDTGYAVWVFEHHAEDGWEEELRFPILQGFYAQQLEASPEEVVVGVYAASEGAYVKTSFGTKEIATATREVQRIVRSALP
jgi:hypothetical protein